MCCIVIVNKIYQPLPNNKTHFTTESAGGAVSGSCPFLLLPFGCIWDVHRLAFLKFLTKKTKQNNTFPSKLANTVLILVEHLRHLKIE